MRNVQCSALGVRRKEERDEWGGTRPVEGGRKRKFLLTHKSKLRTQYSELILTYPSTASGKVIVTHTPAPKVLDISSFP
jgi:hypothetical protein